MRTHGMLTVFMFRKSLVYICVSKNVDSYTFLHRQLENLHIQVWKHLTLAHLSDYRRPKRPADFGPWP